MPFTNIIHDNHEFLVYLDMKIPYFTHESTAILYVYASYSRNFIKQKLWSTDPKPYLLQ